MSASSHPALVVDRNWPLVAAGALMTCVAIGVVFSLAVFLDPMGADTGWPRAGGAGHVTSCRVIGQDAIDGVVPSDHYGVLAELRY